MNKLLNSWMTIYLLLAFSPSFSQSMPEKITQYVSSYVKTGDFSGCILIVSENETLYEDCFGMADHRFGIPNRPDIKFKIGSISKQFTAAAILKLEEQGLLSTEHKLSRYFPEYDFAKEISIEHLLTHTSGLTDIFNIPNFSVLTCEKTTLGGLIHMILEAGPLFEPGTQYQYSNGGYAVLAHLIEKVSGQRFRDFMSQHIFKPLEMWNAGYGAKNEVVTKLATGYDPAGYQDFQVTPVIDPELLKGSGSLHSTTGDLLTWIQSIRNRDFLSANSYEKMMRDYGNGYGYGLSVYQSFGQPVFGHDGRIGGYIGDYLHYEESNVSIIVLGNIQTGVADFFRRDIAAIVFGKTYKSRAKDIPSIDGTLKDQKKLTGTYSFGPGFKVYVDIVDNSLQARANEGSYSELVPLTDGQYFNRTLYAYITFKKDHEGFVSKMIWTNNEGRSFEGKRE